MMAAGIDVEADAFRCGSADDGFVGHVTRIELVREGAVDHDVIRVIDNGDRPAWTAEDGAVRMGRGDRRKGESRSAGKQADQGILWRCHLDVPRQLACKSVFKSMQGGA